MDWRNHRAPFFVLIIMLIGAGVAYSQSSGPAAPPDIDRGATIYTGSCAKCHGDAGYGDGPLVQSGQSDPPPDLTQPTNTEQRPTAWFDAITTSHESGAFPDLDDAARWDVAMYTYTLSYTQAQVERGAEIWTNYCAECHGESGRGDGPKSVDFSRTAGDLTDAAAMSELSDDTLYIITAEGSGADMPAFAEDLPADSLLDVVRYTRTLSLSGQVIDQIPMGTFTGQITNGTATGTVPPNIPLLLQYAEVGGAIEIINTTADAEGRYTFTDIPIRASTNYIITALYRDRVFTSDVIIGNPQVSDYNLPVTIYDLTDDPFAISIIGTTIDIRPFEVPDVGSGLLFSQTITYSNTSDRAYTTNAQAGDRRFASLFVTVPPGALILNDEADTRYIVQQDDDLLIDTAPVLPGPNHQIQVNYFTSYDTGAIIEQQLLDPLFGDVEIHLQPEYLRLTGESFELVETQERDNGTIITVYRGSFELGRGDLLRYEISGSPTATQSEGLLGGNNSLIPVILGGMALLIALFIFLMMRSRNNKDRDINDLIRQIAELDKLHDSGHINHDVYRQQRQDLKTRLDALMNETESQ